MRRNLPIGDCIRDIPRLRAQSGGALQAGLLMMIFGKNHTIDPKEHTPKTKNDSKRTVAAQIQGSLPGSQAVEVTPSPEFCRARR